MAGSSHFPSGDLRVLFVFSFFSDEEKFKITTNFPRCYYELNIDLMGFCPLNMSLLPSCIAFVVSNIIIVQQFINVF